ncbi:hypothetical protein OBBRIDRAFT_37369 [Obba rivulosa]|uniref:Uncharacterized protein n=1 Tax=Obba rivulosa TaxID=1052685 RepID=A0A8E2B0V2_9APHY|nr:hypothetical protein OBBRIDRAFT_37369 [Obba rivulosa]
MPHKTGAFPICSYILKQQLRHSRTMFLHIPYIFLTLFSLYATLILAIPVGKSSLQNAAYVPLGAASGGSSAPQRTHDGVEREADIRPMKGLFENVGGNHLPRANIGDGSTHEEIARKFQISHMDGGWFNVGNGHVPRIDIADGSVAFARANTADAYMAL